MSRGPILYPQVTSLPGQSGIAGNERLRKEQEGVPGEFGQIFDQTIEKLGLNSDTNSDLSQVRSPIKFSAHASQRLRDRKISLDPAVMAKVSEAIDKAEAKGVDDTLVLTKDAALIVNVKNRTVVTALDRNSASGNVFTNIDGAVLV